MSGRAVRWAWKQVCRSPLAKLVLLKLADRANAQGECWPSYASIAKDCGIDRSTAIRQLKTLVASGLLSVEPRSWQANRYVLGSGTAPLVADSHQVVAHSHWGSGTAPPKPITEPIKNYPPNGGLPRARARDPALGPMSTFWKAGENVLRQLELERAQALGADHQPDEPLLGRQRTDEGA